MIGHSSIFAASFGHRQLSKRRRVFRGGVRPRKMSRPPKGDRSINQGGDGDNAAGHSVSAAGLSEDLGTLSVNNQYQHLWFGDFDPDTSSSTSSFSPPVEEDRNPITLLRLSLTSANSSAGQPSSADATRGITRAARSDQPHPNRREKNRSRSSLACVPCRRRKIKCDAKQPICEVCSSRGRSFQCEYVAVTPEENAAERQRRDFSRRLRSVREARPLDARSKSNVMSFPTPGRRARSGTTRSDGGITVTLSSSTRFTAPSPSDERPSLQQYLAAPLSAQTEVIPRLHFAPAPWSKFPDEFAGLPLSATFATADGPHAWMPPMFELDAVSQPSTPLVPYQLAQQEMMATSGITTVSNFPSNPFMPGPASYFPPSSESPSVPSSYFPLMPDNQPTSGSPAVLLPSAQNYPSAQTFDTITSGIPLLPASPSAGGPPFNIVSFSSVSPSSAVETPGNPGSGPAQPETSSAQGIVDWQNAVLYHSDVQDELTNSFAPTGKTEARSGGADVVVATSPPSAGVPSLSPTFNYRRPSMTDRAVASFIAQAERVRRREQTDSPMQVNSSYFTA